MGNDGRDKSKSMGARTWDNKVCAGEGLVVWGVRWSVAVWGWTGIEDGEYSREGTR
jgi:hypothetical protein